MCSIITERGHLMKKRILSLLLVFCLLLPISAFAAGQDNGAACFNYLKDYLKANGTLKSGVYTYKGTETLVNDDGTKTSVDVILTYDSASDALTFGCDMTKALVTYRSEVEVPSALKMPYDAAQHLSALGLTYDNKGKITSDFTTQSKVQLSGETFGTEEVFPYTIALALRYAQDKILTGSGYTIEDLGFSALFRELYSERRGAKAATCTEPGFTGDLVNTLTGEVLEQGSAIAALGHKTELRGAKEPTATVPGYTGDEVCTVCGEVVKKGEVIPATGTDVCDGGDNCPSRDFTDVDHGPKSWYHAAVDWAVTANVTNGKSATSFAPNDSCTRAQMVTFLWRAMGEPEPTLQTSKFVDVPADQYYTKAVLWAVENGITDGVDATHFGPNQTVTRAQTVTFLWRMMEKPAPQGGVSFPDVPSGEYYSDAVSWAVENNITNGMNGVFAPKNDCTRAQIVTFLYRTIVK